jgi:hypothetical protein
VRQQEYKEAKEMKDQKKNRKGAKRQVHLTRNEQASLVRNPEQLLCLKLHMHPNLIVTVKMIT